MILNNLALKYGTDKKMGHHDYTKHYEYWFKSLKNDKIKLLEIGVKKGASVRMWEEYFPLGSIVGIDINKNCLKQRSKRIQIEIGDQGDEVFLNSVGKKYGPFDIIIDDGSHRWRHQIDGHKQLFPYLKKGGLYVIEDLHTSFNSQWSLGAETCTEYLCKLANDMTLARRKGVKPVEHEAVHFYMSMAIIVKR